MENKVSQFLGIDEKGTPDNPLVSIITPVLNGVKYLEACIQSVLTQSYPYIEHIFTDGGSTDGTVELLTSYQAKYPDRIRFISEPDKGPGEGWNKGIRMARGEIFGLLGADDLSEAGAIQTVVDFFRANPEAYFVFGGLNYINEKGEIIGKHRLEDFDLHKLINDWTPLTTPSSFYKREVIKRVGGIDTKGMGSDLDFFIRIGQVFPMHRIEKVLSNFRSHKESQTGNWKTYKAWLRDDYIVSLRYGGGIFSPKSRRYYRRVIIEGLRPILGFTYPLIKKVLRIRIRKLSEHHKEES